MKRVHLLNHRQLLQGFRPRFSAPVLLAVAFVLIIIAMVVVVVLIVIIVVEVPLSTPVLGEANRIVSVIIVIISTGRCPAAGAATTSSTGVLGLMVLRWGLLVNVAFAGGRGCRIAGNVPCAVGPPPFPLVLVADN